MILRPSLLAVRQRPSRRPAVGRFEPEVAPQVADHHPGIDDAIEVGGRDAQGERRLGQAGARRRLRSS
jgi:hypothetical protein